jgi:hypothetical protein
MSENKLEHSMSEAILEQVKTAAYEQGARDILDYLEDVYGDGIHETDVWAEYMEACECHPLEENN